MREGFIQVGTRAVVFNEDNEILVVTNLPETDYYYLPGGRVWFHEKIEDCLVREVKEETGLEVKAERLLWVRDFIEGFPNLHGIELFFLATITGGKFHPVHGTEPLEASFMKVEELEHVRFYPTSFIPKLKTLRDHRDWSETSPYMRSAPRCAQTELEYHDSWLPRFAFISQVSCERERDMHAFCLVWKLLNPGSTSW